MKHGLCYDCAPGRELSRRPNLVERDATVGKSRFPRLPHRPLKACVGLDTEFSAVLSLAPIAC
jgi:hypothetical protein